MVAQHIELGARARELDLLLGGRVGRLHHDSAPPDREQLALGGAHTRRQAAIEVLKVLVGAGEQAVRAHRRDRPRVASGRRAGGAAGRSEQEVLGRDP